MSGTALGWFPKGEAITGENLEAGDLLIGLPSSGIHSNGYTLVRAILERTESSLTEAAPFNPTHVSREIERFEGNNSTSRVSLGEILLNPTRIYVDPLIDLIKQCRDGNGPCEISEIKAMAHITGGGLSNLLRLHNSLGWHIENPLPIPPEFTWLAEQGSVDIREMHRTFNMGLGMVLAVSKSAAQSVESWISERLPGSQIIGIVNDEGNRVTHVNSEVVFEHY
ncbi:MAG: hypothetical protein CXT66_06625 [Methanobacteriota archaeon]|nr:MAG: hypothetical protein CXT66_06625 [Euryarchaeota archaeon]